MFQESNPAHHHKENLTPYLLTVGFLGILAFAYSSGSRLFGWARSVYPEKSAAQIFASMCQLVLASDKPLAEEERGELNILLLGVGGEGQYGSITPDTIVILSLKFARGATSTAMSLLSVPRDLAITMPDDPRLHKINDSYKYAEWGKPGTGPAAAKAAVEDWTGIPIDYYAVIDTEGFREAIDLVGGIDVVVDKPFYDPYYPDGKNGYLPDVVFEAGPQHFDGERALQFARSRHGNNGEASDFARSRRQDKVLEALRAKIMALNPIANPGTVLNLLNTFSGHFEADMEPWQMKRLKDLTVQVPKENIQ